MFEGMTNAGSIFKGSLKAFVAHPALLWPLLLVWMVYAPTILFLHYFLSWDAYDIGEQLLIVFCAILLFSALLSASCFILLEQIRRIETGNTPSILTATAVALWNTGRALPITLAWAFIWFLISVVEMILVRGNDADQGAEFNAQNAARTLSGLDDVSLSRAFFEALRKGVRMVAFLIFPAIAWDSGRGAVKRGIGIVRTHKAEFASGFVLTEIAAGIVFLPPAVLFLLSSKFGVEFADWVWVSTIIYCGLAWSFSMLLEQLFTAELYLWHMAWKRQLETLPASEQSTLKLQNVRRPSILDDIPELEGAGGG